MSPVNYIPEHAKELSKEEIKRLVKENNVQFIRLQFVDINGQVKNMAVPSIQIDKVLNNELMLDGSSIKGFRNIETSDMYFFPDRKTFSILPWRSKEDGSNVGRYEALPYQVAEQLNLANLPDWLLSDGTIWTVQTDDQGRVVEMQPYIYGSDEQLTEEEAADLLFEFGEVRDYLEQGMTMFFEGRTEVIGEEPCVVIALGTDHGEAFVRERFYAVSPSGRIYIYDPFTDAWNAAKMD